MVKKVVLLILLLFFFGCEPGVENTKENAVKLFASNNFEFYVKSPIRFPGKTVLFTVSKKEKGYVIGSSESHKGMVVSNKKMEGFKLFFIKLISSEKEGCEKSAGTFTIRAYNYSHIIEYSNCTDKWDEINEILNLEEILPKE
ncbi:MAG: hypothetical protein QM783_21195 [Phycisphaerales bacterium]